MSDESPVRERRDLDQDLFAGLAERTVRLQLPADLAGRIRAVLRARGWEAVWGPEAPLLLFAHGLSALRIERELTAVQAAPASALAERTEALRRRWMDLEGAYAVLKFRAFELGRSVHLLTIRRNALRADNRGLAVRLERFARDRSALEAEIAALRAQIGEAGGPQPASPAPAGGASHHSAGLLGRLRTWLGA